MPLKFDFSGQTALVTGGTSGLGEAIALGLAEAGANVAVTGRDKNRADGVAAAIRAKGVNGIGILADVRRPGDVKDSVAAVLKQFGKIDVLVNSAGVFRTCPAIELSDDEWEDMIGTNLKGTFLYCREAAPSMIANGYGKIVNLASTDSFVAVEGELGYCVSKAGVVALTRVLAVEWIKQGVYVNAVAPCDFETPLIAPYMQRPEYSSWTLGAIPIGRIGQPPELVPAVLYLCSPESSMVVGHTLAVDGGRTII